jgi:serine phosphatase RsbU (regulator of sigma subunit)
MLGAPRHEPHVETCVLPVGGTLLLYTDGLVEDRTVLLDDNLEKLRVTAAKAASAEVQAFANQVVSTFGPSEDDVAMIAVRRTSAQASGL